MPRYVEIDSINFENIRGTDNVGGLRNITSLSLGTSTPVANFRDVDQAAASREIFGEEGENKSYLIVENNAALMLDKGFDFRRIDVIKVNYGQR